MNINEDHEKEKTAIEEKQQKNPFDASFKEVYGRSGRRYRTDYSDNCHNTQYLQDGVQRQGTNKDLIDKYINAGKGDVPAPENEKEQPEKDMQEMNRTSITENSDAANIEKAEESVPKEILMHENTEKSDIADIEKNSDTDIQNSNEVHKYPDLEYKGYIGTAECLEGTCNFYGKVQNIDDDIIYEGITFEELEYNFHKMVDTYIDENEPLEGKDGIPKKKEKKEKKNGIGKAIVCGLLFGLFAGAAFEAVDIGAQYLPIGNKTETTQTVKESSSNVAAVAEEAMPSIVSITSTYQTSSQTVLGQNPNTETTGAGSGVIIGQDGRGLYIVTNNHVISGASKLSVGFIDGNTASADVRGVNEEIDIAIIKVKFSDMKKSTKKATKIMKLGDSDKLSVGENAIAIGNALGYGQSVTSGCISALNREVTLSDGTMKLIQTDAAINPGNSGGALLNSKGELIGINNAKVSSESVEGVGYAIPINSALESISEVPPVKRVASCFIDNRTLIAD